jgi:anti-anti-sigma factor
MDEVVEIRVVVDEIADGVIVRPVGAIDRSNVPSLRAQIDEVQRRRPARLVIDLARVPSIDSAAVAALVETLRVARCGSMLLILCNLQEKVRALLKIVRLDSTVFPIVDTVDEAVALPNRRKFERFELDELRCDLGEILDISASGMRLLVNRKPRGRVDLRLAHRETEVGLTAEVVWTHRIRFREHEAGLRFVGLDAAAATKLAELMGFAADQSVRRRTAGLRAKRGQAPPAAA